MMKLGRSAAASRAVFLAVLALLLVASELPAAESVSCSLSQLLPCRDAFFSSATPSAACCAKLKEQQPCFCQYLKDPSLAPYVNSPAVRRIGAACGVAYPKC